MKKSVVWAICAVALLFVGCVEKTQKYKDLLSRADSLNQVVLAQNEEMEQMFADINDITLGMQSLREAEQLLLLETEKEGKALPKSKQQLNRLKNDVLALKEAIAGYKLKIVELDKKNKAKSQEFKRMIDYLNAELAMRDEKIEAITQQLVRKNQELSIKTKEVEKLTQNMKQLNKTSKGQKMIIAEQDQRLHQAHYLIGSRKALKEAKVISRQGIFAPLIVSLQTQNADFINIDIREIVSIPLNDKKAKVLSAHPKESYALVADDEGNLILKINDVKSFWKQTRYLVVMVG
jgi:chromosome segregation ATPase